MSLAEALAALPDTADGIAAHLTQLGIRGRAGSMCACPFAVYLESLGMRQPIVTSVTVGVYADGTRRRLPTPPAVREFARRVDRGEYPALLDNQPPTEQTS